MSQDGGSYVERAARIYQAGYAGQYPSLYVAPWKAKHDLNVENLTGIFRQLASPMPRWLDLACGHAWHFARFPGRARMVGLDLSRSQLLWARADAPHASYVQADMARVHFSRASFDLVTGFWAGYCYLGSRARIGRLMRRAVSWIQTGGALYIEVLLGRDLESFNRSRFAQGTGFTVIPRTPDYTEWRYIDRGGSHEMTSPPLAFFLELLSPAFDTLDAQHDAGFMVHLIARGRKPG